MAILVVGLGAVGAMVLTTLPATAAPGPTVSTVSPGSFPQGVASQSVVVTGSNFQSGATVTSHSGITAITTTIVSSTEIDILLDIAGTVAPGSYNVFVTNPDSSIGSCTGCLTVTPGSPPSITSVSPSTVPQAANGVSLTLTGSNFLDGATVTSHAGINFATTFLSSNVLGLRVTISTSVATGVYDVFVKNPDNAVASCLNCLTIVPSVGSGTLRPGFVGMASVPDGSGYWLASSDGAVSPHGSAVNYGSMAGRHLNAPITHIVATPSGRGYWLVAADGGTFTFGDAGFFGSMGGRHLNAPVVDIAPTGDGGGYWLVASDGGVFAFGDAPFRGSMGGRHLNRPVVGVAADTTTGGYWLVATDGGIFSFGAPFFGSTGGMHLNQPVNGMASEPSGRGYWLVASDGGIFTFGAIPFEGSAGGSHLNAPVVGMASNGSSGYWLVASDGGVFSYGATFFGST